jgi:hypothetical protein
MVAMSVLCGTRISYTCFLIHLVGGDLAGGIEEGGDSFGRRFHRVDGLVQSTCVIDLVLEASDWFKGSMATTSALEPWSLGDRDRRLPECHYHQQRQSNSSKAEAHQRLALAAALIITWSKTSM